MKEYTISYKVFSLPWYFTFSCYAENAEQAITKFIKSSDYSGVERFYISSVHDI